MFSTTDVGNTAFWTMLMFLFLAVCGLEGAGKMILALLAVFIVACILHK